MAKGFLVTRMRVGQLIKLQFGLGAILLQRTVYCILTQRMGQATQDCLTSAELRTRMSVTNTLKF